MVTRTTLFIFIACVFGAHVFSQIAHGMVLRGSALVPPGERERIYQRQARIAGLLDLIDYLAIGILLVGMARCLGYIRYAPKTPWGLYAIGGGLALMCLGKVIRSWSLAGAYRAETAESNAIGAVVRAAVLVTVVEIALAGGVCWWLAKNWVWSGGGSSAPASQGSGDGSGADGASGTDGTGRQERKIMIGEAEAQKILGKDREYLRLLAQIEEVRTEQKDGETWYRYDDVTGVKEAGLRSIEELRNLAKKRSAPPPPPKQPSPPVAPSVEDASPKQDAEPLRE